MDTPMTLGDQQADLDSWRKTLLFRLGTVFKSLVNEFVHVVQFICKPTNATASYEKVGIIVEGRQADPSDYTNGITKDGVAISGTTTICDDNAKGRAWGAYLEAGWEPGCDGSMGALELGLRNNGSEQPDLDTPTSKTVLGLVAGEGPGNKNVTVGIRLVGGSAKFFSGVLVESQAMADPKNGVVYGVRNTDGSFNFKVTTDGSVTVKRFKPPFIPAPTISPMEPGEEIIWGNTTTGITYRVFFDGGSFLKTRMTTED